MKLILALLLVIASANINANEIQRTYKFGVVPQFEIKKLQSIWQPLLKKLEKETGRHFELIATPDIPSFENAFVRGEYDFVYFNPYHMIVANDKQGYTPLVRDIKKNLSGVLVIRNDSNIHNITQLDSKKIAFPSPNALGASLQIRQELKDNFSIDIEPVYVKTHDSVYLNVLLKRTAAGGGVQKTLNRQKQDIKNSLKVIYRTKSVPSHPIAVHPRVSTNEARLVQNAFIMISNDDLGKSLLNKIPMTKVGITEYKDYEVLKQMNLERFAQ